jgi:hypothetical protein
MENLAQAGFIATKERRLALVSLNYRFFSGFFDRDANTVRRQRPTVGYGIRQAIKA